MTAAAEQVSEALDDLEAVREKLRELAHEGRVDELIDLVIDLLARVRSDNNSLAQQLKTALRMLYGRRSEKVSSAQLSLMFDGLGKDVPASAENALSSTSDGNDPIPPPRRAPRGLKGKRGRSRLPEHLPREVQTQLVPEGDRKCAACGTEKSDRSATPGCAGAADVHGAQPRVFLNAAGVRASSGRSKRSRWVPRRSKAQVR